MIDPTYENIQSALSYLYPPIDHLEWFKFAASIKSALGDDGFTLFDEWSSTGDNYDKHAVLATWKGCRENGSITIGTVFGLALERGWKPQADAYQETEQERQQREQERKNRLAKETEDRAKKAALALDKTKQLLIAAKPAQADHPYLLKKGVKPIDTLRELPAHQVSKILGYVPKSSGEPLTGRILIAPVLVDFVLSTAELIDENGKKTAIAGGIKSGGCWLAQDLPNRDESINIIIGEGVSTTLSAKQGTEFYAVAALSAGNMPKIAKTLRDNYPNATIIVLGDIGNGQHYAETAAESTQSLFALPHFTDDQVQQFTEQHGKAPTDFNDLHTIAGLDTVSQQLTALLSPDLTPSDAQALLKQAVELEQWWKPNDLIIENEENVIITQRIADAKALIEAGHCAVAVLDLNKFPLASFLPYFGKKIKWLIGYDRDKKTQSYIETLRELLEKSTEKAALIAISEEDPKNDWANCKKLSDKHITRYINLGGIIGAKNKEEVCFYTFKLHDEKIRHCVIDYKNSTYSCDIDMDSYNGIAELTAFLPITNIKRIYEAKLNYLYHQEPENGEDGRYVFRVDFANFAPSKELVLSHTAFVSGAKFKESALKVAGMMFDGETRDVNFLYKKWMANWKKTVKTLDYIGYNKETKAYIFNDYAFQAGKVIPLNTEGYFHLPSGHSVKTLMECGQTLNLTKPIDWFNDYKLAYHKVGLVALAWHTGSLFAEQIREKHASYPFFELYDQEGGTGKSHLVEVLSKLMGRDYTPFNPMTSRPAARMRRFADSSNLPIYCNESENEDRKPHTANFSWNELKDAYEGKGIRSIGIKSNDNRTKTPPFRVTLMIIQNVPVHADGPFLQRMISQVMTTKHHTIEGRHADMRLMQAHKDELSGWLVNVLTQEQAILKRFFNRYAVHNAKLQHNPKLKSQRIMHNHAQMMALIDCLDLVTPISEQTQNTMLEHIEKMAEEREVFLKKDHPLVQQFWDNYHYLSSCIELTDADGFPILDPLNHSNNPQEIAINLNDFRRYCFEKRQEMPDEKELKRHLSTGVTHKLIEANRAICSRITKKTSRVWVFKKGGA